VTAGTLHYHPLSSYCQKVLIAVDVLGVDVDKRLLNLGDPAERGAHLARWPIGKMPLLVDKGRAIPETSIIIEYLERHHALAGRTLIPSDGAALEVRLWDRIFDQYVMTPMQAFTADLLRAESERDPINVDQARMTLLSAYETIDAQLENRSWIASDGFSMADCAAAPSLFYAVTYVSIPIHHARLHVYFDRLMDHPSVALTIDQARPYFKFYPGRAGLSRRFFDPAES